MEQTKPNSPASIASATANWPGAFGAYSPSAAAVRRNLGTFVALWGVLFAGSVLIGIAFRQSFFLRELLAIALGAYMGVAVVSALLASLRDKTVEFQAALQSAAPLFLKMLGLQVIVLLAVVVGLLLLIIPGLIIAPRLALAQYFLVDKKMDVLDAIKASWHATAGHVGKVWGIIGVSILIVLPAITVIGILATVYLAFMYQAVLGLLYLHLRKK